MELEHKDRLSKCQSFLSILWSFFRFRNLHEMCSPRNWSCMLGTQKMHLKKVKRWNPTSILKVLLYDLERVFVELNVELKRRREIIYSFLDNLTSLVRFQILQNRQKIGHSRRSGSVQHWTQQWWNCSLRPKQNNFATSSNKNKIKLKINWFTDYKIEYDRESWFIINFRRSWNYWKT